MNNLQYEKYNLFLDDFRVVTDAYNYTKDSRFLKLEWVIVRSYDEFVDFITQELKRDRFPAIIAFDHDLADDHYEHTSGKFPYDNMVEKTGFHCAQWLIELCIDNDIKMPEYTVHSMNPVGKENIINLIENYKKHCE